VTAMVCPRCDSELEPPNHWDGDHAWSCPECPDESRWDSLWSVAASILPV